MSGASVRAAAAVLFAIVLLGAVPSAVEGVSKLGFEYQIRKNGGTGFGGSPRFPMLKGTGIYTRRTAVGNHKLFRLEFDTEGTQSEFEYVTVPFAETLVGRQRLCEAMTRMRADLAALENGATNCAAGANHFWFHHVHTVCAANFQLDANIIFQYTFGVTLPRVLTLFSTMTTNGWWSPGGSPYHNKAVLRLANNALFGLDPGATPINALSDEAKGFLFIIAIVRLAGARINGGNCHDSPKQFTDIMPRTEFRKIKNRLAPGDFATLTAMMQGDGLPVGTNRITIANLVDRLLHHQFLAVPGAYNAYTNPLPNRLYGNGYKISPLYCADGPMFDHWITEIMQGGVLGGGMDSMQNGIKSEFNTMGSLGYFSDGKHGDYILFEMRFIRTSGVPAAIPWQTVIDDFALRAFDFHRRFNALGAGAVPLDHLLTKSSPVDATPHAMLLAPAATAPGTCQAPNIVQIDGNLNLLPPPPGMTAAQRRAARHRAKGHRFAQRSLQADTETEADAAEVEAGSKMASQPFTPVLEKAVTKWLADQQKAILTEHAKDTEYVKLHPDAKGADIAPVPKSFEAWEDPDNKAFNSGSDDQGPAVVHAKPTASPTPAAPKKL